METKRAQIRRLMLAVNRLDGLYYQFAREQNAKDSMLSLLYALDDGAPHFQKQVCEEWLIPKTTINTIVLECVSKGYIQLAEAGHKREKMLCLTERGKAYTAELLQPLYHAEESAMELASHAEQERMIHALEHFVEEMEQELSKIPEKE